MYSGTLCGVSVHFLAVGEKYEVISVCECASVCVCVECTYFSVKGKGCSWFQSVRWTMK